MFSLIVSAMLAATPIQAGMTQTGGLRIGKAEISLRCRAENKNYVIDAPYTESEKPERTFTIQVPKKEKVFSGTAVWKENPDGSISGQYNLLCTNDVDTQELALRIEFPVSAYPEPCWEVDGTAFTAKFEGGRNREQGEFKKDGDFWTVKFGPYQKPMTFSKGDRLSFGINLASPAGFKLDGYRHFVINESDEWIRIENNKFVFPGSALDFSGMGVLDGPSGKYGWLKAVGGDFEFEGKPGVPQRFLGANLCMSANFCEHDLADSLLNRLASLGHNAIRIHHHDRDLHAPGNWEKLDYLIARGIKMGFYFTTDLYVSRRVKYSDLGLEGEGEINKNLYKNLIVCHEPAFEDWCKYAREFLDHVNPYTGRAYKDEPAIALVSLINEGKLYGVGDKSYYPIKAVWERFGGEGKVTVKNPKYKEFEEELTHRAFVKCSEYVKSLGIKALLTNDNNGWNHGEGQGTTPLYDYVDNHFYIDHPKFIGKRWTLPSRCQNINIVLEGGPSMFRKNYIKTASKPYTVTEWNFCGPNRYRGNAGLVCGAMASMNGWDGLWRFAYSHSSKDVAYNPDSYPSNFNLATDPLNLASERAMFFLFTRRDVTRKDQLIMDREQGTMKVVSDRTCGMFRFDGQDTAGPLTATISGAPATLWVSTLDNEAIKSSSRMLLTHITDVQGAGMTYADDNRNVIIKWGKGTLIQKGSADISLALDSPEKYIVYELSGSGNRVAKVPSRIAGGSLEFTVSTNGKYGGCIYYEIIRRK